MKTYYIDTAIWIDYYEERKDNVKDIGEIAFQLLSLILASKSKVVVSSFVLKELENRYSLDEIRGIMFPFQHLIEKADISKKQFEEAKLISAQRNVPKGDALHAILARDYNAVLVSRDKHFLLLKDICTYAKPEDII
jgi:predicted nucleic acid-binding protein